MEHQLFVKSSKTCYLVFTIFLTLADVKCYNVEVKNVGIANGDSGSQFGYSVSIVPKNNGQTV